MVLGRDRNENQVIRGFCADQDRILTISDIPGPWCLLSGILGDDDIEKAARICAAYSDTEQGQECIVDVRYRDEIEKISVTVDKKDRTEFRI